MHLESQVSPRNAGGSIGLSYVLTDIKSDLNPAYTNRFRAANSLMRAINQKSTDFELHCESQKRKRLTVHPRRAQKSSVFSE